MPVVSIANLADLLSLLEQTSDQSLTTYRQAVADYRARWGVI
jgi:hypothetical protein